MIESAGPASADSAVYRPESITHLRSMLSSEIAPDQRISVHGGRTRGGYGNVGGATDVTIDTTGLYRIIDFSPDDLVLAVEAGATIESINSVLSDAGQCLPIDAAHPSSSTVGGAFATGISGPRRLKYGSLKDAVVGIEVTGPDGETAKAGGMVVKNVSGYDLSRLHYGALGIFGIVTRLNFKVQPMPDAARRIVGEFNQGDEAWDVVLELWRSGFELTSLVARVERERVEIQVLIDGSARKIESLTDRISRTLLDSHRRAEVEFQDVDPVHPSLDLQFIDMRPDHGVVRLSSPVSQQRETVDTLLRAGCRVAYADIGSNLVYGIAEPTMEWRQAMLHAFDRLAFLALPERLRKGIDVTGGVNAAFEPVIRRLKHEFAPRGRLNANRGAMRL
ncbi:MAG: FAD-binding oxidoreductase [Chloroflexota bacterium]